MMPLIECVPNFSEGRDAAVLDALAAEVPPAILLDRTADPDHNRSVLTLAGPPEAVLDAALRLARAARSLIDLRRHSGVHPRIGALDVLPFVPLEGVTLEDCAAMAHRAGERIWKELEIPVYFYEAAALAPERRNLAHVRSRRAGAPDLGLDPHPTAGAVAVGARKFLIAFNVNLQSNDLGAARAIASEVRESSGGLPCVKALGLPLASRGIVQVSMNLTDFELTPLAQAFLAVRGAAHARGIEIAGSELIGLIPRRALAGTEALDFRWENFRPDSVLEVRLAAAQEKGGWTPT
jgi:glutamate formiminotransferase/glutamate formiminotransferase/formiminotetrahydrofolate cyclodeaminase